MAPRNSEAAVAQAATGEAEAEEDDARGAVGIVAGAAGVAADCVLDAACRGRETTRLVLLVATLPPGVKPCPGVEPGRLLLVAVCKDQSSLLERS